MDRRNSFDLVRLIAACAVLFSHCFPLAGRGRSEPIAQLTRYGSLGELAVDAFFIVSGFLVARSYLRGGGWLDFLIKRLLRLLPGLWCAIFLTVCVLGPVLTTLPTDRYFASHETHDYLRNLYLSIRYGLPGVFTSNPYPNAVNGSLWTLPLEALMYFLILVLGVFGVLNQKGCAALILLFGLLHFWIPSSVFTKNGVVFHQMPYPQLTSLGIFYFSGAFYAMSGSDWNQRPAAALVCVVVLLLFATSPSAELVSYFALPYLILWTAHGQSRMAAWVSRLGDFSYGIYIYAFPVQQTIAMLSGEQHLTPLSLFAISLPFTLVLGGASWYLVERPFLRLKRLKSVKELRGIALSEPDALAAPMASPVDEAKTAGK